MIFEPDFESKSDFGWIGRFNAKLSETDPENVIFSKPLNWVFGKTLKYRIKKLNTWPGQLKHALLTFRTPLAPTKSSFPPFEPFFQISEKTFGPKIHI